MEVGTNGGTHGAIKVIRASLGNGLVALVDPPARPRHVEASPTLKDNDKMIFMMG